MGAIMSMLRSPPAAPAGVDEPPPSDATSSPLTHAGVDEPPPSDATSSPPPEAGVELAGVEPLLSTGQAARRRRKRLNRRQRERADIGASSSGAHELNAATLDANTNAKNADTNAKNASDAKNGESSGTPGLYAARTAASAEDASSKGAADPKITEPASTDPDALTADAKKHEPCSDASKIDATAEAASSTGAYDPKIAEPASTDPRALHLRTPAMRIGFPIDASPVSDHDGLHRVALPVAATPTDQKWNKVPEKKSRPPPAPRTPQPRRPAAAATRSPGFAARAPAAAAVGQQRPNATAAVGLLDDLEGVKSFFGNLFEEELDEDQRRAEMHRGYVEACSTLKKKYIYCLPCFLSEDNKKKQIENSTQEISKHMDSAHKGASFPCAKKGCLAMATNRKDIGLHQLYAHQM